MNNAELLYYDQPIPSPLGLPKYELILNCNSTLKDVGILNSIKYINNKEKIGNILHNDHTSLNIETTGSRVNTHRQVYMIVQQLNNIRQCASSYVAREKKVYFVKHLPHEIQSAKTVSFIKYLHSLKSSLLKASLLKRFQYNSTTLWNHHTEKVVKLIISPVSLHDEIRTNGYGIALIELLVHLGLLNEYTDLISRIKR